MTRKTAVIYARVSTPGQAEKELPVESQVEQCRAKAAELDLEVVRVFVDDGISGRSTERRVAFNDALDYCAAYDIDHFITWDPNISLL